MRKISSVPGYDMPLREVKIPQRQREDWAKIVKGWHMKHNKKPRLLSHLKK